jgi:hypothetical protein
MSWEGTITVRFLKVCVKNGTDQYLFPSHSHNYISLCLAQLCTIGGDEKRPIQLDVTVGNIVRFAAGSESSYIVLDNGSAFACGRNDVGQLGDGSTIDNILSTVSKANMGGGKIVRVRAGTSARSVFFQTDDGRIWGSGLNDRGQLGVGDKNNKSTPAGVKNSKGIYQHASDTHSLMSQPSQNPSQPICERLPNDNGIVRTLQNLLWTKKPQEGLLMQVPDYLSQGWRAMSHLNNHLMATNPVYPITYYTSTTCPVPTDKFGNGCSDEGGSCPYNGISPTLPCDDPSKMPFPWRTVDCDGYDSDPTWDYAVVSLVYGTNYEQNSNRAEYNVNGAKARVNVCYPTDANSVDGRVRDDGVATSDTEGLGGCHTDDPTLGTQKVDQDYVCDKSTGNCLTGSTNCKCWYDGVPGKKAGEWITKYSQAVCGLGEK